MGVLERDLADGQWDVVSENIKLVYTWVNRLPVALRDDAVTDGVLGLLRGIQTYDPSLGKFGTHASQTIRTAITAGRGRSEGINWRSQGRAAYIPPSDIDAEYLHVAAPGPSVEHDACVRSTLAQLIADLRANCRDELDHRIVDGFADPTYDSLQGLAKRLVTPDTITWGGIKYRALRLLACVNRDDYLACLAA